MQQPSAMCWPLSGGGGRIALALRQRLDGAAERRARLEQRDLVPAVDEVERGRQPGEPAADDDRPHRSASGGTGRLATARTFATAESDGRREKTSKSRPRICTSRPR